jgi:serine/threonine protein kinase
MVGTNLGGDSPDSHALFHVRFLTILLSSDFGISRYARADSLASQPIRGTPAYLSPEIWKDEEVNYYLADVYAFGILLNFMLTRSEPNSELGDFAYQIMQGATTHVRPTLRRIDCRRVECLVGLVESCWSDDPGQRPQTFEVIMKQLSAAEKYAQQDDNLGESSSS